ncbi:MAG: helix-hairpin-helix domain-containing protein [Candidatus Staskawiczbacteria bacterium]|nr:helix-hairpin-helix domain-containing protein [Candidatus Staskawiczbacteria bacterium]
MKKVLFLFFSFLFIPVFVYAENKIDINAAPQSQLEELAGVGPVIGQRIIDARPFSSVDDLLRVKGIGEKTLQKIKDQGSAYAGQVEIEQAKVEQGKVEQTEVEQAETRSPQTLKSYPSGVFINEILPNPKGPDETEEWIEVYNSNNFEADLSGWKIQDTVGKIATYTIIKGTKISADGFLVFKRPDTKIMLNNDKDGLKLLTPDNKSVDSAEFEKPPLNQSYNKISGSWKWSQALTPGAKNIINVAAFKNNAASKPLSEIKKSDNGNVYLKDLTAGLNQEDTERSNPWFLFFYIFIYYRDFFCNSFIYKVKIFKKDKLKPCQDTVMQKP